MTAPIDRQVAAADPATSQASSAHSGPEGAGQPAAAATSPNPAPLDPAYLEGVGAIGEERQGYEALAAALRGYGVQAEAGRAVLGWLQETRQRGGPPAQEAARHNFDVDASRFQADDQVYLTAFLNAAAQKGLAQEDVDAALKVFGEISNGVARERAADYRALEDARREVAAEIWNEVRALDPNEFTANRQLLVAYLRGLPPADREATDALPLADLVRRARGSWAAGSMTVTDEIASIEKFMRENRSAYDKDTGRQARLRDLYRARDGG